MHPIPKSTPAVVLVKYIDRKQEEHIELMQVSALRTTSKLQNRGKHVVVSGPWKGDLVTHIKSDLDMARVYTEGTDRSKAFYIEKSKLCIAEQMMCVFRITITC